MQITDELVKALDQLEGAVRRHAEAECAYDAALAQVVRLQEAVGAANNALINTRQSVYRVLEYRK